MGCHPQDALQWIVFQVGPGPPTCVCYRPHLCTSGKATELMAREESRREEFTGACNATELFHPQTGIKVWQGAYAMVGFYVDDTE